MWFLFFFILSQKIFKSQSKSFLRMILETKQHIIFLSWVGKNEDHKHHAPQHRQTGILISCWVNINEGKPARPAKASARWEYVKSPALFPSLPAFHFCCFSFHVFVAGPWEHGSRSATSTLSNVL